MSDIDKMSTLTKQQRRKLSPELRNMHAILVRKYWWYLNRFNAQLDVQTARKYFEEYQSRFVALKKADVALKAAMDLVKAEVASKKKHHLAMLNILSNMLPTKNSALVALDDYIV
jgi:hypothetical protein